MLFSWEPESAAMQFSWILKVYDTQCDLDVNDCKMVQDLRLWDKLANLALGKKGSSQGLVSS